MTKIKELWKKYWKLLLGVALLALFILNNYYQKQANEILQKKFDVSQQNIAALTDSIRITQDRQGRDEAVRYAFLVSNNKELAKINKELADEVAAIKGKVSSIVSTTVEVKEVPYPYIVKAELLDSLITAHFSRDTVFSPGNYRSEVGYTQYNLKDGTVVAEKTKDVMGISLVTGIKDLDKGKPEIFVKSDYPGFTVTQLSGAQLDPKLFTPKKKTPLITPSLTVGWTPLTYDWKSGQSQFSLNRVGVTAGIGFNLFKLAGLKK